MANVVVLTRRGDGQAVYGIFHIHFSENGKLESAAAFKDFTVFYTQQEWKNEWCNIIRSVYPQELNEQGC